MIEKAVQPLNLYLDLEPRSQADIEVVARATLEWAALIRDVALRIDPFCDVRIELESGTEGSLSLNGLVRVVRCAVPTRLHLKAIALAVMLWMGEHAVEWGYERVLDWIMANDQEVTRSLTDQEIAEVAKQVADGLKAQQAEHHSRRIFREIEMDTVIRGVGVGTRSGERPAYVVPRSEFGERASQRIGEEEVINRRTVVSTMEVTLVSPVLKDAERSWKFQYGQLPEFGAVMRDHVFLEAWVMGEIDPPIRPGFEMLIELNSREEQEAGVWVVKERWVSRVLRPAVLRRGLFPE